jgi:hypothetical protein
VTKKPLTDEQRAEWRLPNDPLNLWNGGTGTEGRSFSFHTFRLLFHQESAKVTAGDENAENSKKNQ